MTAIAAADGKRGCGGGIGTLARGCDGAGGGTRGCEVGCDGGGSGARGSDDGRGFDSGLICCCAAAERAWLRDALSDDTDGGRTRRPVVDLKPSPGVVSGRGTAMPESDVAQHVLEQRRQLVRRLHALVVGREAAPHDRAHRLREVRRQLVDRLRRHGADVDDERGEAVAFVWPGAGEALEHHHAERPDVRARVGRGRRARLLRAHVPRRAEDRAGARGHVVAGELADAEVEHLREREAGRAVLVQEHVRRLDVAVDDADGVRRGERLRRVEQDREEVLHADRRIGVERVAEGHPVEQLHDEVEDAVVHLPDVEHVDDVRVVDLRRGARLAREALARVLVRGRVRVHELDREVAAGARVDRAPDLAHAADTEP
jgi:hypothetical protein